MARSISSLLVITLSVAGLATGASRASVEAAGCSVHVDPSQNVQAVIDRHTSGAVICFDRGVYRIRTPLIPKAGMRLVGASGAILSGAKRLTVFERRDAFWVATGQRQQQRVSDEQCRPATYTGCRYAEGVYIDGRPLLQVTTREALGRGRFYFDYGQDEIWIADDPSGRVVETSIAPSAVVGYGDHQPGVVIEGFVIQMFASPPDGLPAAVKPGNGWVIRNNEIRFNHRLGVYANPGVTIVNNDIHDNGLAGIRGQGSGIQVIGNRIVHNNIELFSDWWSGGARFTSTTGLVLRDNYVARNLTYGLKTDTDNIRVVIEGNRIVGNRNSGIAHEKGYEALIAGNYLKNNARTARGKSVAFGAQILLNSSSDTEIVGNTVVCSAPLNAIGLRHDRRGSGRYGPFEIRNVVVHHNVVRMVEGSQLGLSSVDPAAFSSWGNRFHDNRYSLGSLDARYFVWTGDFLDAAGWRAAGNDVDGTFARW